MKRILVSAMAVALAFATVSVYAARKDGTGGGAPRKDVVKAPLQDMTLTGKIAQTETTKTNKAGVDVKIVKFTLTETDGTVVALNITKKAGATPVDLATYIGKAVKIVGQGRTETSKTGKTTKRLVSITTIEEVLPPPPVATPAAAPAVEAE